MQWGFPNRPTFASDTSTFTTAAPTVVINDVSVQEGRSSTTSATSAVDVVVQWQTADGTATSADNDYQAASGSLTIPAGSLRGTIAVTVNGDDRYEADETFYVNLTGALNATVDYPKGYPSTSWGVRPRLRR